MHRTLEQRVSRLRIHGVEHAVDRLIAASAEEQYAENFLGLGIGLHLLVST
jgi:hypothetical protein